MKKDKYKLLYSSGTTYEISLFLEASLDEMGVMVGFDGDIEQVEQLINFTYTQNTGTTEEYKINVYNTVNPNKIRTITDQTFTIDFGDNTTTDLSFSSSNLLPSASYTYPSIPSKYDLTLTMTSPWETKKIVKEITVPFTGITINDEYDFEYVNNYTGYTEFTYVAFGKSRIEELKNYGSNTYSGVTTGTDSNGNYSGYTIDGFYYKDYDDNYTMITGNTSGYTKEDVFNEVLTRNEHFIGFVDEPTIYSDIFIERGKLGVMENNFRLSEVDSIGELIVYGNGFFNIRKQ